MNQDLQRVFVGIVLVIFIGVLGYLAWQERQGSIAPPSSSASSTSIALTVGTSTSSSSSSSSSVTIVGPGYTITRITLPRSVSAPDYKAPLTCAADVSADVCAQTQSGFAQAQAAVEASSTDFNAWIALGDYRKEAGDYAGAAADWQYMSALYPTNVVSFANLGDLYANYLHEYAKAVTAYKQEIVNDPTLVYIYQDLYQLYTTQYPQPSAVIVSMLKQGIAANPTSIDLQLTFARYYKSEGDSADAKAEYAAAAQNAQTQGETQLAQQIQNEAAQ